MKRELQNKLFAKYPALFCQKNLPPEETCMCWGIECGDGWYWLIDNLCSAITTYNTNFKLTIEVTQVKEKFGMLRFYISGGVEEVFGMITLAEHMSANICEQCGERGHRHGDGWIFTLCEKCWQKRQKQKP